MKLIQAQSNSLQDHLKDNENRSCAVNLWVVPWRQRKHCEEISRLQQNQTSPLPESCQVKASVSCTPTSLGMTLLPLRHQRTHMYFTTSEWWTRIKAQYGVPSCHPGHGFSSSFNQMRPSAPATVSYTMVLLFCGHLKWALWKWVSAWSMLLPPPLPLTVLQERCTWTSCVLLCYFGDLLTSNCTVLIP